MRKQKENRITILQIVFGLMFLAIFVKLFILMINQGEHYRDLSDNRKVQEVDEIASRGDILDRNGNVLATTVPSFAVQLYKDKLTSLDDEDRIKAVNSLVNILEEAGVNYQNDFDIRLNSFQYKSEDDYFKEEKSPEDKIVDIIVEKKLTREIVGSFSNKDGIKYETIKTALLALKKRGIDIPILVKQKNNKLNLVYKENAKEKLKALGHSTKDDPLDVVVSAIGDDKSVIKNILENNQARLLTYNILKEKNLESNVILKDYSLMADEKLIQKKASLNDGYPEIKLDTKASDDFYEIVKKSSIKEFLKSASLNEEDGSYLIPADILIEKLENKGIYANFTTEVKTETKDKKNIYSVDIKFKNSQAGDPAEELANLADKHKLLKGVILDKDLKYLAQNANAINNVYPSIDISEDKPSKWDYTFNVAKKDFFEYYASRDKNESRDKVVKKLNKAKSAKEVLDYIKSVSDIKNDNDYEACGILTIDSIINRQGSFGFRPINLVYNLDDSTVLRIEENIDKSKGISVATIPIRSYPNRNLASHVLGYMGPIATDEEVEKYVKKDSYLRDEIVGKTGIEESYQDTLRGKNGKSIVTVDSSGNRIETLSKTPSEPGNDVYLSIDANLQAQAEKSLSKVLESIRTGKTYESEYGNFNTSEIAPYSTNGAVVVSNVKTGEVLAMASYPSYDPNLFSTGISSSDWESLQVDDGSSVLAARPMLNVASQTAVMPGSTFKLVTSLAALEKGLNPQMTNYCNGFMDIGSRRFSCLIWSTTGTTHGEENLYDAIRDSCNYYFYCLALGENPSTGKSLGFKLELSDVKKAASTLGLDETSGIEINIPQESSGNIPSVEKKLEVTKSLMKKYLDKNIKKYLKKNVKKTKSDIENDKNELVKLADNPNSINRKKLIEMIDKMGYEPLEIKKDDRAGLADTLKFTYLNQAKWDITDMLNIVIGQGQNSYTPLQMNRVMSTISNGGYLNKYTLIKEVTNHNSKDILYQNQVKHKKISIKDDKYLEDIKYGTLLVAQNNAILNRMPLEVGVKTGTAEVEGKNPDGSGYDPYAWMIGFAPYDDPEIAISIILTQGATSFNVSPIFRDIVCKYFDIKINPDKQNLLNKVKTEGNNQENTQGE
ncbi:penicillin-binding protein [Anaerococcus obesiensis]|uniref:Beta-lactamase n=1 Tax=Anaerococcus obesiensis TaxID=1287640 RepID=A0A7T7ZVG8_9FIRM|nr:MULTISPECIES: penicillin-binding transpeptidase domain-containing protein [Anaerococcus]MDU0945576.1 penicillin-binding transpeptidase domain-containing protein [Anaerococcus vaginalis]MDU1030592.1 penicillin-binding transpeptidase domain-containing protein [Anaerococcus vaginalis]QQN55600.1 penicillin-binding protein [Anaerococcus obesiensis]